LVFLIFQQRKNKENLIELVRKVASTINIPFTVGGGISSVEDVILIAVQNRPIKFQ
jgi:cyclase